VSTACDNCLRRGALVGLLARPIAGRLERPRRVAALLALPNDALIDAVAGPVRPQAERLLEEFDPEPARRELEEVGSHAVCRHDPDYPERLRHMVDPPNPLYVRGSVARMAQLASEPCVAIVGARRCSSYARTVAADIGRGLAAAEVTVVSGLAQGVDGAAHRGALAGGTSALAVIASGPEYVYPKVNADVYAAIAREGAIVSELPPGTRPWKWSFPARNRIMAALSRVVVIVEAARASGSLITAEFASEMDCTVAAVPGHVTARGAAGSNDLLHEGAPVVRDAEDVLDLLYGVGQGKRAPAPETKLEPRLREVLDAVELGDGLGDAATRAGLSGGQLRAALGRLESLGFVTTDGFGGYTRTAAR
jgi:DNA processing protein